MFLLESSLSLIALALCVFAALLVRVLSAQVSLRWLVIFLLLTAFGFGMEWLLINPHSPYKALWLGLFMASFFFIAPCLWLFANETAMNKPPSLALISVGEWGVVALGCLLTVPLILAAHKGNLLVDPARAGLSPLEPIIHESMLAAIALFLMQVPWYLRKTWCLIREQRQKDFDLFSNIDNMPLSSLRVLMWFTAATWLLSLTRVLRALFIRGPSVLDPVFTCVSAGITLWALYVILKRGILFSSPARDELKPRYAKSVLDDNIRKRIQEKLQVAMLQEHLYTDSNLKLHELCKRLSESPHHVSQVINESLHSSFYELINQYRVDAAKEALSQRPNDSILTIAMEVGFNSKSTFNAAFKRVAGVTPSEFREMHAST